MDENDQITGNPQQENDDTTLSIEMLNITGTYLQHLNDDCLLQIFSELDPVDLYSLSETCKRFRPIAQQVFPKELEIQHCYTDFRIKSKDSERRTASGRYIKGILKNFGSKIVALSVCGFDADDIHLVAKYCVGTLKQLEISYMRITQLVAVHLKPILQQLQQLKIVVVGFMCSANVFSNCDSLTELTIRHIPKCNAILKNTFPKLRRFCFRFNNGDLVDRRNLDHQNLLNFFDHNSTLKYVNISTPRLWRNTLLVQMLGKSCKELEVLQIHDNYVRTLDFSNFPNLRQLRLGRGFEFPKASIVQLQSLQSLEVLKIKGAFHEKDIMGSVPLLKNLREFEIKLDPTTEQNQVESWSLQFRRSTRLNDSL